MEIADHVSQQMLSRYARIRTEAKRKALEDVERTRTAAKVRIAAQSEERAAEVPPRAVQ